MAFIKNTWYMAMWAEYLEIGKPQERTIIGESIVIFRTSDGALTALQNRCPHRGAPLHLGKPCGSGRIQCGYHGLVFDSSGSCVVNPHGSHSLPTNARVRPYPIVEKHGIIWVWMGNRPADLSLVPDVSLLDTPEQEHVTYKDVMEMDAHYELVIDNLLDLSHTPFLHYGVLASDGSLSAEISAAQDGQKVIVSRWMPNIQPPGLFDVMFNRDGRNVDHWAEIVWEPPGYLVIDSGVTNVGAKKEEGTGIYGIHILTPVHERRTRYHFVAVRQNPKMFPESLQKEIMDKLRHLRRHAFETEDEPMIVAQQKSIDSVREGFKPVLFEVDAGTVRYKRVLERMHREDG